MGALQQRAFPRSSSQERMGRLSDGRIGVPQLVQREAGNARLSPRGSRGITTFRKLPKTSPNGTPMPIQNHSGNSATVTLRAYTDSDIWRSGPLLCCKARMADEPNLTTLSLDRYLAPAKALVARAQALADERRHLEVQPLHLLSRALERGRSTRVVFERATPNVLDFESAVERALQTLPQSRERSYLSD